MKYPVMIEWGDDKTATGIVFPDIPGAITAGDTLEEAFTMAVEAAHIMLEEIVAAGDEMPLPKPAEVHVADPEYQGWGLGYVEIDLTRYLGKTEKANLTLPSSLIRAIDEHVRLHGLKSRSAYLAELAYKNLHMQNIG